MKLKLTIVLGFISLFFILLSHTLQAGQQVEETAIASAQKWLTLIDEGKYSESWNEAAEFFKTAVSKKDWLKSMEAFRKPLGALISRKLKSKNTLRAYQALLTVNMLSFNTKRLLNIRNPLSKRLPQCWIRMVSGRYQDITSNNRLIYPHD
jgi:hypothetical protein